MAHVLVAGKLHPSGIALLDQAIGITYDYIEDVSEESYVSRIGGAEALVIRTQPLTAATVAKAPNLRIVSRHGVGFDSVDVDALNARSIPLAIVGDANSRAVAEHAMMMMLAAAKRLPRSDRAVRNGQWDYRDALEGTELCGKHLLIVGYGRVGRHLARMASPFDMRVTAYDPFIDVDKAPDGPATLVTDLQAALPSADFVSVHVPKSDGPALGADELARLKPTAIVVNTARGGVVDETALRAALDAGHLAAAALDVFETEPPAANNQLLEMDQVILTPHTAGLTIECAERMAVSCVQNVLDFFEGRLDQERVVNAPS